MTDDVDDRRRGWLHETHPNLWYRWLVPNRLMRNDEHGIEITYRPSRIGDVICGARTVHPGMGSAAIITYEGVDRSVPHEVVCGFVGDHGEAPHIGAPFTCVATMNPGDCSDARHSHIVPVGFAIRPSVVPRVTADQDVWGPNESEEP